jgi:hypothetical protein
MIRNADLRPAGDQLRLFGTALAIVICFTLVLFLSVKYQIDWSTYLGTQYDRAFFFWITGVCAAATYFLLRFIIGRNKRDDLYVKAVKAIVRLFHRA